MDFNQAALGIGEVARNHASSIPVSSLKETVVPALRTSLRQSNGFDAKVGFDYTP
jgi:hypothetical protein